MNFLHCESFTADAPNIAGKLVGIIVMRTIKWRKSVLGVFGLPVIIPAILPPELTCGLKFTKPLYISSYLLPAGCGLILVVHFLNIHLLLVRVTQHISVSNPGFNENKCVPVMKCTV